MPSEEEEPTSEELMHQATVDLLCASTKCDQTYEGKYKHFCRWVDAERVGGQIPSDQPTYITQMNLDKYLHAVVVNVVSLSTAFDCPRFQILAGSRVVAQFP
jgi:hypothetical protein